jgi:hypothetical protein
VVERLHLKSRQL